jgi:hypothetical protein
VPNPFLFGSPVSGEHFTGRRTELRDLVGRMSDHINVAIISPRRYGKSSLLTEACDRVQRQGGTVARLNAMTVSSDLGLFASRLITEVYHAGGPWTRAKDSVATFAKALSHLRPSTTFDIAGNARFTLALTDAEQRPADVVERCFELMAQAKTPVVCVDEFQELLKLPGDLPAIFKGMTDQFAGVSLVVAGSQEHMMRRLTVDTGGALYRAVDAMTLGPIPADELGDYVQRRFNVGGKSISRELADRIVMLAAPVPNDVQHLAYAVYATVETSRTVAGGDVDAGLTAVIAQETGLFADSFMSLTGGQQKVLITLAKQPDLPPQSGEFLAASGYANPSGVKRALDALHSQGAVAARAGRWVVVSPFLRSWLASL